MLIQDLYSASKDNQSFLHARFGLGRDVLKPYKATISRWSNPNVLKDQYFSVSDGMAELDVFYCEECVKFANTYGMNDAGYVSALVSMFEQSLKSIKKLEPKR